MTHTERFDLIRITEDSDLFYVLLGGDGAGGVHTFATREEAERFARQHQDDDGMITSTLPGPVGGEDDDDDNFTEEDEADERAERDAAAKQAECRYCGCTAKAACQTPHGPCGWRHLAGFDSPYSVCDAPICVLADAAFCAGKFLSLFLEPGALSKFSEEGVRANARDLIAAIVEAMPSPRATP